MIEAIAIGATRIQITGGDPEFERMLRRHYSAFLENPPRDPIRLEVELTPPRETPPEDDLEVRFENGVWILTRGDFDATYDPRLRRGSIRQSANRFSTDTVLRIVHSLELARDGGLLVHAASAIRDGRAFLFAGPSGVGKTTISGLAPAGVDLLTDEISYVRTGSGAAGFRAYGTPFTGELARQGVNRSAPLATCYFLRQSAVNRVSPIAPADALRMLLGCVLFFASDQPLVRRVFDIAADFVAKTEILLLEFTPDARVWNLIGE